MLTLTILLPAVTAILLLVIPRENKPAIRMTALFGSLVTLGFSLALLSRFDVDAPLNAAAGELATFQLVEDHDWIPSLGVRYIVGLDGISLFLVVLSALITPISVLCSWRSVDKRVREFHVALLFLECGTLGVFLAIDLVLFYVFWEVMLIPMYLLVGIWGSGDRIRAAVKFFIFTMAGSLLMFLAILYVYSHLGATSPEGAGSFDIRAIYASLRESPIAGTAGCLCFTAFALAFAIKVPLFPFHTWLPDAHTEAPTAGSVVLAAVLLKMGTYGFIRFAIPFFPEAAVDLAPWISVLSIIGIVFGALMCFVQDDMKKLIAYSSVSHMGFVMLGLFAYTASGDMDERSVGVTGCVLQMLNHGLSTGALFLLIGAVYERRHTRKIAEYGGIAPIVPRFAVLFFVTTLSSIGLPFLNGFVGEFLILQGTYRQSIAYAGFAGTGVILGAVYMLGLYRDVFLGGVTKEDNRKLSDLDGREMSFLVPLIALMVLLGLFSPWLTERVEPTVRQWMELVTVSR